jgi:hypothetical protein
MMSENFETFLELDKKGLENQYIILVKGRVVAKGFDIEKMLARVRKKYPKTTPFVAKIPDGRMMVLYPIPLPTRTVLFRQNRASFTQFQIVSDERKGWVDFKKHSVKRGKPTFPNKRTKRKIPRSR